MNYGAPTAPSAPKPQTTKNFVPKIFAGFL